MVALLTKSEISSLNIDTVEKALVFGALYLRASLSGSDDAEADNFDVAINISASGETTGNLNLEVNLPYSAYNLSANGGVLLDSIIEYTSISPNLPVDLSLSAQAATEPPLIPDYDETRITTFEQYLLYFCQILWASVTDKSSNTISISLLGNQEEPKVFVSVNLPFNLDQWLLGSNYLDSISRVVDSYNFPVISPPGGGDQPTLVSYDTGITDVIPYDFYEFHTVANAGRLLWIDISGDFASEFWTDEAYFYLNGSEMSFDSLIAYDETGGEITFNEGQIFIFVEAGDTLEVEFGEDPPPTYVDFTIHILEGLPPIQ